MRNIKVKNDSIHCIDSKLFSSSDVHIAGLTYSRSYSDLLLLTNNGVLLCFNIATSSFRFSCALNTASTESSSDTEWFDIDYNHVTSAATCISHSGKIFSVKYRPNVENSYSTINQEVIIEGGISSSRWNSTHKFLIIATNKDTLLLMSDTFEVLQQLNTDVRLPHSPTCISWRGDGSFFSVMSTDKADHTNRVRMYNRNLELVSMGRNSADGELSVMRGLGSVTAYATNGSYVAVPQQRIKGKHQVLFLDGAGLTVDSFDVQMPVIPRGFEEWCVDHLEWDLNSALIAVCFHAVPRGGDGGDNTSSAAAHEINLGSSLDSSRQRNHPSVVKTEPVDTIQILSSSQPAAAMKSRRRVPSFVQLYFRNTYYWYLKQQWEGDSVRFLGFDSQVANRLYLSQIMATSSVASSSSSPGSVAWVVTPAVRIVDITWEITNSLSSASISDSLGEQTAVASIKIETPSSSSSSAQIEVIRSSATTGVDPQQRESEWARQKLGHDEKAQRCRDRNKIDARNTRNRKRQQLEELQLKIQDLTEEKTRLFGSLPAVEQNSDVASILMLLAGAAGEGSDIASSSTVQLGGNITTTNSNNSTSNSLGGNNKRGFDSISAIVAAAGTDLNSDDDEDNDEEEDEGSGGVGGGAVGRSVLPVFGVTQPQVAGKPANAKELAEERRKERNRIHAKKARARRKVLLSDLLTSISTLEEDIRRAKQQIFAAAMVPTPDVGMK